MKCIDDEIPFEIPQSWCWTRICNITQSYIGLTYSPSEVSSQGTIVLRSSNIKNGRLDLCDIVRVSKEIPEKLKVAPNDIIICARNGSKRLVGKSAIVDTVNEPMTFGAFMAICKTPLYKYIYQFLQSDLFFSQLRDVSGTTTINQLTQNNFNAFLVPIPPIEEQQRIVERIEEIMPIADKYEKSQEALDKLNADIFDKLKKSVLQEAIQGRLVPQDPNDEPASKLLERIKEEKANLFKDGKLKKKDLVDSVIFKGEDNKYYETIDGKTECIDERIPFDLPHNWCWATLGNLVQNCSGLAYKKENLDERSTSYIRVLRGGNIDDGQWTMKDDDVMIASKFVKPELLLTAGTFITPAVTSIEQMGKTALVREDQPQTVVGGFVLMLLPFMRDWSLLNYLELIFQSEYYKGYCRSITNKSGQAFYNLSRQKLMQFLVPLPPLNERIAIANEVAKINSLAR